MQPTNPKPHLYNRSSARRGEHHSILWSIIPVKSLSFIIHSSIPSLPGPFLFNIEFIFSNSHFQFPFTRLGVRISSVFGVKFILLWVWFYLDMQVSVCFAFIICFYKQKKNRNCTFNQNMYLYTYPCSPSHLLVIGYTSVYRSCIYTYIDDHIFPLHGRAALYSHIVIFVWTKNHHVSYINLHQWTKSSKRNTYYPLQ